MFDPIIHGRRRDGRRMAGAMGVSVVAHALIVLLLVFGLGPKGFRWVDEAWGRGPDAADREGGGGGGGGGGELVSYVEIPAPPPPPPPLPVPPEEEVLPPIVPPPPPVETKPEETAKPTPVPGTTPTPAPPAPAAGGAGGGEGPGQGPGQRPGQGPGRGGGTGGGEGGGEGSVVGPGRGGGEGRIRAPTTDFLLIPPDAPPSIRGRGRQIKLAVDIDERGNVTDARVVTSSGDRRYDGQVVRRAREWKFNPAREVATNRAVAVRDFPLEFDI